MPEPKQEPTMITSDDFRTIYTNFVQAGFTPYDISLILGQSEVTDQGLVVQRNARVVMSPAEAKAAMRILGQVITNYEDTWGKIVEPQFQNPGTKNTEGV